MTQNILTSSIGVFKEAPKTLLKEHYRCHPKIIDFCNQKYYDNELVILTTESTDQKPLHLIKTVPGHHARKNPHGTGLYNQREIDEIMTLAYRYQHTSLGVITPYRIQADKLASLMKDDFPKAEVDTVHKFQGRAKDVVILSTVVNQLNEDTTSTQKEDFVSRDDLLNVAVSRAKDELHLVVSEGVYHSKNNAISDLIRYMEYHQEFSNIEEGKVTSVFDLLYADQTEKLREFRKKYHKTQHDSENLILNLIEKLLSESTFKHQRDAMHVPLSNLVKTAHGFNEEEERYLTHPWTHVDFLIYNQFTKTPTLVIEVDGVSYHEQNEKQRSRDKLKDAALQQNRIPMIRLKTNESQEEKRVKEALMKSVH